MATPDIRIHGNTSLLGALTFAKPVEQLPDSARLGTLVLHDKMLYGYLQIGQLETWYPFCSATQSYVHSQGLASDVWVVEHGLGTSNVWFQVRDEDGAVHQVASETVDVNTFRLLFVQPMLGTVVVVAPDSIDVPSVKASLISIGSNVLIDNTGVRIGGQYVLTQASIATEIATAIQAVVGAAPAALDTLAELGTRLQAGEGVAEAITLDLTDIRAQLATKADRATTYTIEQTTAVLTELEQTLTDGGNF